MDDKELAVFDGIRADIKRIADTLGQKPSKVDRIISTAASIAGALGIVGVGDIIVKWITGG